ncbi:hypothetical protein E5288_WYG019274 [Bos mutus]|uniref:Uncharacterized protein n=1 Tax=Bos mutus TaxID=72004 RepID=A0A6B0S700_9CETA|nr:hypothetical protein [Bos mutus]
MELKSLGHIHRTRPPKKWYCAEIKKPPLISAPNVHSRKYRIKGYSFMLVVLVECLETTVGLTWAVSSGPGKVNRLHSYQPEHRSSNGPNKDPELPRWNGIFIARVISLRQRANSGPLVKTSVGDSKEHHGEKCSSRDKVQDRCLLCHPEVKMLLNYLSPELRMQLSLLPLSNGIIRRKCEGQSRSPSDGCRKDGRTRSPKALGLSKNSTGFPCQKHLSIESCDNIARDARCSALSPPAMLNKPQVHPADKILAFPHFYHLGFPKTNRSIQQTHHFNVPCTFKFNSMSKDGQV